MTNSTKKIYTVLGMHRSGTSAIVRALKVFNISLGNNLMPPQEGVNDKGFWEDNDLNALNVEMLHSISTSWYSLAPIEAEDIKSLKNSDYFERAVALIKSKLKKSRAFGLKDPRLSKLLPFWKEVLNAIRAEKYFIIVIRNPLSVAESLAKRDNFAYIHSYYLWLDHVLASLKYTRNEKAIVIDYDRLIDSPENELKRLANKFNLTINDNEMTDYISEFLDYKLRHTSFSINEVINNDDMPCTVKEMFTSLVDVASDKSDLGEAEFINKIDNWVFENVELKPALLLANRFESIMSSIRIHNCKLLKAIAPVESRILRDELNKSWYLANNKDVVIAGIDAYEHWQSNGYKEGRMPASDSITLATDLVLERDNLLQKTIVDNSVQLAQLKHETEEKQRQFELQIAEIKLNARDEVNDALSALIGREQSFSEQLGDLQRAFYKDMMVEQEAMRKQFLILAEQYSVRESSLQQMLSEKESEIRNIYKEFQDRERILDSEITQTKLKARDEIDNQLSLLVEREKSFSEQLITLQRITNQERIADQEATRQQIVAMAEEYSIRERYLQKIIAEKELELKLNQKTAIEDRSLLNSKINEIEKLFEMEHSIRISEQNEMLINIDLLKSKLEKITSNWAYKLIFPKTK
jgi:hypothetical protein